MIEPIAYREMQPGEVGKVCAFVREVFDAFVAPDYDETGVNEFRNFADPLAMSRRSASGSFVLLAVLGDGILGMIELMPPDHIALLFVARRRHGIARALLSRAVAWARARDAGVRKITVNSSPYAEPAYEALGFVRTADRTTRDGITFIPMTLRLDGASAPNGSVSGACTRET